MLSTDVLLTVCGERVTGLLSVVDGLAGPVATLQSQSVLLYPAPGGIISSDVLC